MLTKGIDGCKDIASRIRMAVIDFNAWRIDGGVGMLIDVDGCKDIASGITVIDDELWLKYSLHYSEMRIILSFSSMYSCGLASHLNRENNKFLIAHHFFSANSQKVARPSAASGYTRSKSTGTTNRPSSRLD